MNVIATRSEFLHSTTQLFWRLAYDIGNYIDKEWHDEATRKVRVKSEQPSIFDYTR